MEIVERVYHIMCINCRNKDYNCSNDTFIDCMDNNWMQQKKYGFSDLYYM